MKMTFFSVILLGSFLARADYFPEISPGSTAPMTASKTLATFMGTVKQAVKRSMGKGCPDQVDKICAGDIVVMGERNHSLSQEPSLAIVDRADGLNFSNESNAQLTFLISSRHPPSASNRRVERRLMHSAPVLVGFAMRSKCAVRLRLHGPLTQFSIFSPSIRLNSFSLFVTKVRPRNRGGFLWMNVGPSE